MIVSFWILYVIAGTTDILDGFLFFVGVMAIGQSYFVPVDWAVACIALFAAIQEGHYIRSS